MKHIERTSYLERLKGLYHWNILLQIRDAYPKLFLANTHHLEYQYEGIRIINITDWLTGSK